MGLIKCKLGELITQRREKNPGGDLPIRGVSKDGLIPPKQIDADTSIYNVYYRNDFVFNPARMELNSIAFNDEYDKAICSSLYEIFYVHRTDIILPEYLALIVRRDNFRRFCEFIGTGSAREYCRVANISEYPLTLPSIDEQRKIVHDYKVVSDRIELLKKINKNYRNFLQVLFDKLIRNVDCSNGSVQQTEIGEYPSDWDLKQLGDVLVTIIDHRGITPLKLGGDWSDTGIIALSAKSVKNHELVNLDIANKVDEKLYKKWMSEELQPQDILMTSEAPLGEFYYLAEYSKYCLSQRLFAMRADKTIIEPSVLYFQLSDIIGFNQIDSRKTGTTVFGIRQAELVKIPVIVPPLDVQKTFSNVADKVLLNIEKNSDEIRVLNNLLVLQSANIV